MGGELGRNNVMLVAIQVAVTAGLSAMRRGCLCYVSRQQELLPTEVWIAVEPVIPSSIRILNLAEPVQPANTPVAVLHR
jgi:hypothetical protein